MRLILGPPPAPDHELWWSDWTPLREPGPWTLNAIAVPIGAFFAYAVLVSWGRWTPFHSFTVEHSLVLLVQLALLFAVHEVLHALAHPGLGLERDSIIGFWPTRLLFYAHYEGCLSRNRLIFVYLLPTISLTFLPLLLAGVSGIGNNWLMLLSATNALVAGGDLLGAALLFVQVPAAAQVRNHGYKTYWQKAASEA
jgi:hypothetical protein